MLFGLPEWKNEIFDLYNLGRMIKELKLFEQMGKELGIKGSSVRRQLDRIFAYFEEREGIQKRSGKGKMEAYTKAMREILEKMFGRPILTICLASSRKILFDKLEDALRYSKPIANISGLYFDYEKGAWVVCIPKDSVPLTPYDD